MTYLQTRHAALDGQEPPRVAAQYVEAFAAAGDLRAALIDEETIGYVSEAAIDVRVGGPLQARYYLSQFALTPLLLELEPEGAAQHPLVLANFETARELNEFLAAESRQIVISIGDGIALTEERVTP
jgi:hypothetical protein